MSDKCIGCGDNSCIFSCIRPKGGVGTNGGCRCFKNLEAWVDDGDSGQRRNHDEVRKVRQDTQRLAGELLRTRKALQRALSRCTNCDTCGPATCPECDIDRAALSQ